MERLIKTLELTNGELFYVQNGNRYKLAKCEPSLEIHEKSTQVSALGRATPGIKRIYFELILCRETEFCREIDERFFSNIVAYSMKADVYRPDGIFETLYFDRMNFEEITSDGTMKFSLVCPQELADKLMGY